MKKSLLPYLILLCAVTLTASLVADKLPPRGMLGLLGSQQVNDQGMEITQVAPNSTASALGLKVGDRLTKLNGQKITSFSDLISAMNPLRAGSEINVVITRGEESLALVGKLQARPQETSEDFNVIADVVDVGNNRLRSYIYQPKGLKNNEKRPAVFYIQGYTCSSVDWGSLPQLTIRQLFADITKAGYVVYRVEKFGVGDSLGDKQCSEIDFTTELSGFHAALAELKKLPYVDAEQIHIFGHSLGGLYAPLVAQKAPVKSIMVYGTVVKPWYDYLLDIYSEQALLFGTDKQEAANNRKLIQPLIDAWLNSQRDLKDIQQDPKLKDALASNLIPINGDQIFHRHYSFFRDQNQYDFKSVWESLNTPTLAIHGEYDIQAINDQWTKDLVNSVNKKNKKLAKSVIIPKTEHALMTYPSRAALMDAMANGQNNVANPGEHYTDATLKVVLNWLKDLK
ncbi:alpha/beta fold hydrolase [Pleionea litopenaei]|uniref:Site-2 protease family protein n=1 Tax=Pleionea litopenaei TaxID=3070815 RepID=A0AA51X688_9GAMM|nr:alpha/beta fold hydrolase [Pleionea sp. HL-JVS1]WMS87037.1 site-2 protease family protein [Pleionea sp. HL-JVS1]